MSVRRTSRTTACRLRRSSRVCGSSCRRSLPKGGHWRSGLKLLWQGGPYDMISRPMLTSSEVSSAEARVRLATRAIRLVALVAKPSVEKGVPVIRGSNLSEDLVFAQSSDLVLIDEFAGRKLLVIVTPRDLVFTCWGYDQSSRHC